MSRTPTTGRLAVGGQTALMSGAHTPHVLVAAADAAARLRRERQLHASGARVATTRTGFEAIVKASCQMPDLVVLDESLGQAEMAETARLLMTSPVTARTPVLCLPGSRRVPIGLLSSLRMQGVT
jgi:CheY-like chemotaxis protein